MAILGPWILAAVELVLLHSLGVTHDLNVVFDCDAFLTALVDSDLILFGIHIKLLSLLEASKLLVEADIVTIRALRKVDLWRLGEAGEWLFGGNFAEWAIDQPHINTDIFCGIQVIKLTLLVNSRIDL